MQNARRMELALEAIERIAQYTEGGRPEFDADELRQVWVLYHLRIIDETLQALATSLGEQMPAGYWSDASRLRQALLGMSFDSDLEPVWWAVTHDLPRLQGWLDQSLFDLGAKP